MRLRTWIFFSGFWLLSSRGRDDPARAFRIVQIELVPASATEFSRSHKGHGRQLQRRSGHRFAAVPVHSTQEPRRAILWASLQASFCEWRYRSGACLRLHGGNNFGGLPPTAKVTACYRRFATDALGLRRTQKRPEALILLGLPAFVGLLRTITWWLWVDSNHRPQHYECCALTG
jgi:hypothetical protein